MAGDFGVCRSFAQGGNEELGPAMHGYLQGTGESREPWSRELGAKQESGVRRQESGDSTDDCVLTFKFGAPLFFETGFQGKFPKAALQSVDRLVAVRIRN
jgi:hypothetical protein